jgi:TRAP-type C4-dicarboxylate transport system permease small subunit
LKISMSDRIWNVIWVIISILFFVGTVVTAINVIMRKFFDKPWVGAEEMDAVLLVLMVYLPLAYLEWTGKQLNVSILYDRLSAKAQFVVRKLQHIVILVITGYLTIGTWEVIQRNWEAGNKTASLGVPFWLLYTIIGVGFGLTALTKLAQVFMPERTGDQHVN